MPPDDKLSAIHRDIGYIKKGVEVTEKKIDCLDQKLTLLNGQSVKQHQCDERQKHISQSIETLKESVDKACQVASEAQLEVTASHKMPKTFDIWSWAGKRIPVIIGILVLLAMLGGVYKTYLAAESNRESTRKDRVHMHKALKKLLKQKNTQ